MALLKRKEYKGFILGSDSLLGTEEGISQIIFIQLKSLLINSGFMDLINALNSIDASEYDVIRKRELAESERLMRSDIDNQKTAEREKKKAVVQSHPSDKDELIKLSVQRIMSVTEQFKVKDIIETAKNLYDQGSYSIVDNKEFTRDVMKKMEGKKVYHKKKPDKNFR